MMNQSLAPNSTNGGEQEYSDRGNDESKIQAQAMPNTRANDYICTEYAGPEQKKHKPKMKTVHRESMES
jgi:hypothetical protein